MAREDKMTRDRMKHQMARKTTRVIGIVGAAAAVAATFIAAFVATRAPSARAQGGLFNPAGIADATTSDPGKIVDLTYTFDASTVYWPTEGGFEHKFELFGMQPGGYFYSSAKFAAAEHGGTHMDAPLHFNRDGMSVDQVPMSYFVGPAVVIDFSARSENYPDATLSVVGPPSLRKNPRPDSVGSDRGGALGMGPLLARQEALSRKRQAGRRRASAFSRLLTRSGQIFTHQPQRDGIGN